MASKRQGYFCPRGFCLTAERADKTLSAQRNWASGAEVDARGERPLAVGPEEVGPSWSRHDGRDPQVLEETARQRRRHLPRSRVSLGWIWLALRFSR